MNRSAEVHPFNWPRTKPKLHKNINIGCMYYSIFIHISGIFLTELIIFTQQALDHAVECYQGVQTDSFPLVQTRAWWKHVVCGHSLLTTSSLCLQIYCCCTILSRCL